METVRFASRTELRKLTDKQITKLCDTSDRFAEDVVNEYYRRQQMVMNRAQREIRRDEKLERKKLERAQNSDTR